VIVLWHIRFYRCLLGEGQVVACAAPAAPAALAGLALIFILESSSCGSNGPLGRPGATGNFPVRVFRGWPVRHAFRG